MWSSRVLSADADLPDLGAVVGQLGRDARGVADLTARHRYGGHVVGGGRDLPERAHLTADQDDGQGTGDPDADQDQNELGGHHPHDRAVDASVGSP